MTVTINGDTGISPVTASGTSASIDGMTVGKGGGEVASNTAVGNGALSGNTSGGTQQNAFGYQALYSASSAGSNNAFGYQSLYSNTGGYLNSSFGDKTLFSNSSGAFNTAYGAQALYSNSTASNNTAVGYQAGYTNATGTSDTFVGYQAGYASTGGYNTLVGYSAGSAITTGYGNAFFGTNSGNAVTTGNNNTILGTYTGNQGGLDIRTASGYIVLSDGSGNPRMTISPSGDVFTSGTTSNNFATGAGVVLVGGRGLFTANGASPLAVSRLTNTGALLDWFYGGSYLGGVTTNGSTVTYGGTSDYRLKEDIKPLENALYKVAKLKPCEFTWKSTGLKDDGFIAHELAEVCPNAVVGEKDELNEDGSIKPQLIDTSFLVATLTAAIQELNAKVAELEAKVK